MCSPKRPGLARAAYSLEPQLHSPSIHPCPCLLWARQADFRSALPRLSRSLSICLSVRQTKSQYSQNGEDGAPSQVVLHHLDARSLTETQVRGLRSNLCLCLFSPTAPITRYSLILQACLRSNASMLYRNLRDCPTGESEHGAARFRLRRQYQGEIPR